MQALVKLWPDRTKFGVANRAMTAMMQTTISTAKSDSSSVKAEREFLFLSLMQLNQHRSTNSVATINLSTHLAARDAELVEQF